MIIIRNINLDELLELLNGIRLEAGSVDMEVNEDNKEIIFVPIKDKKTDYIKQSSDDITERIKKMKEEFEKEKEKNEIEVKQLGAPPKINLQDLNKLF